MRRALLQIHAAVFLWGFTGVLGRLISLAELPLVWYRLAITVVSFFVLLLVTRRLRRLPWRDALAIGGIGVILAAHWVCFYGSIKLANVTIALTCLSTSALLSAVIEPLLLRQPFQWRQLLLGSLALAGILLIYRTHLEFSLGIWVGLLSALLTVIVTVLNKRLVHRFDASLYSFYQLSGGLIGLSLVVLWLLFQGQSFPVPKTLDWGWLLILSWLCTILTANLYIRGLRSVSAFTLNLILTLEPVYGILLAFLIYNESALFGGTFYLGFALIIAGVVLHTLGLVKGKPKPG